MALSLLLDKQRFLLLLPVFHWPLPLLSAFMRRRSIRFLITPGFKSCLLRISIKKSFKTARFEAANSKVVPLHFN